MTPPYNRWRQRQAYTIELYRLGLHPHVIAWWIGVSPHTVWKYLRECRGSCGLDRWRRCQSCHERRIGNCTHGSVPPRWWRAQVL